MVKIELQLSSDQLYVEKLEVIGEPQPLKIVENGSSLRHAHFVDPISVIAVISTALLVERIVDHWLCSQEEGVQVDLREEPSRFSRIAGVPYGFLMVIHSDDTIENLKYDYDKRSNLKDVLTKFLKTKSPE